MQKQGSGGSPITFSCCLSGIWDLSPANEWSTSVWNSWKEFYQRKSGIGETVPLLMCIHFLSCRNSKKPGHGLWAKSFLPKVMISTLQQLFRSKQSITSLECLLFVVFSALGILQGYFLLPLSSSSSIPILASPVIVPNALDFILAIK